MAGNRPASNLDYREIGLIVETKTCLAKHVRWNLFRCRPKPLNAWQTPMWTPPIRHFTTWGWLIVLTMAWALDAAVTGPVDVVGQLSSSEFATYIAPQSYRDWGNELCKHQRALVIHGLYVGFPSPLLS